MRVSELKDDDYIYVRREGAEYFGKKKDFDLTENDLVYEAKQYCVEDFDLFETIKKYYSIDEDQEDLIYEKIKDVAGLNLINRVITETVQNNLYHRGSAIVNDLDIKPFRFVVAYLI